MIPKGTFLEPKRPAQNPPAEVSLDVDPCGYWPSDAGPCGADAVETLVHINPCMGTLPVCALHVRVAEPW